MKEKYTIKPLEKKKALEIIIKEHYLHRRCAASFCFGLFKGEEVIGVIIYGTPPSASLRMCCGQEHTKDVIELMRLWVRDDAEKNLESFLIGNTLKMIDKPIVVSYADTSQGHLGKVYQATNWLYTGTSVPGYYLECEGLHYISLMDSVGSAKFEDIKKKFPNVKKIPRSKKHRYIYFNCSKKKKKYLLNKLKFPILPYPKELNEEAAEISKLTKHLCNVCGFITDDIQQFNEHFGRKFHQSNV
jgi:hypothetical protein